MSAYDSTQMIRDDRDLRDVEKEIWNSAKSGAMHLPSRSGVYGVLLNETSTLPGLKSGGLIYIGKAHVLARRGHFKTENTSRSTLRRTLGAVLKRKLRLRAFARNASDFSHYLFDESGEKRLTEWMESNLRIGFSLVEDDIADIEKRLIRYCEATLNLSHWANPQSALIRELRKVCVEEASRSGMRNYAS